VLGRIIALFLTIFISIGVATARAAEEVDLLLVLASDVSRSVDAPKFKLLRDGYAAAIINPRVIQAIRSGALGKIAVSFVEWSGVGAQKVVIDWTVIRDEATAKDFSAQLVEAPRARRSNFNRRRYRFRDGPARTFTVPGQPTYRRGIWQWHQ
jgi:hypothetical protein